MSSIPIGMETPGAQRLQRTEMSAHSPRGNRLLAILRAEDYERLSGYFDVVALRAGMKLHDSGDSLEHVYFPIDSVISLLYVMENGASAEIAVAGNDGMIGVAVCLGGETARFRAVVRSAGHACRLRASVLKREFEQSGALRSLLLRYTQALLTQMAQAAVCNRHHAIGQQLCRWLLVSLDHLPANRLDTTHAQIADMLGVRREGITAAATRLQQAGLIRYHRGQITVLDRAKLEAQVCDCYAAVKRETNRLLGIEIYF